MESTHIGWWRRHAWTIAILLSAFSISLIVRTLFAAPLLQQFGPLYLYGGGSDSFYHSWVTTYTILNHHNLVVDQMLRYPFGAVNPREPLFDWMNAILGILFSRFFGGNAVASGAFFLDIQAPVWAALGVFPVYLIGKEVSSRRMGLIAAVLYALMVANIDSSVLGYANYLSFYTFFILLVIYGYLRTIRAAGSRRWVESYRHPRQFPGALRAFVRTERTAVKWAVFTGVSFGALALAWQGYSFAVAAIIVFLVFAMIVERIRRVDSFGLYVSTWIVGLVGFPMAVPYYLVQGLFAGWFDLPLLVFFGALLILLPFLVLRDQPWVLSVPVLAIIGVAAIGVLDVVNHAFFTNIVTGQGYFVKTLVYSTVAEAQAPSIDALILGYGVVTFFLAFVGLALFLVRMARQRFPRTVMMFVVFGIISIYLPISAAKFFFLGSAAFALLPAEAIARALDVGGYATLRRTAASLADRRSKLSAFRRAFKARHVLVMLLLVGLILPNVWYAMDAGIPYNSKSQYSQQIINSLPAPLRSNISSYYLGAAGVQLDTPNQYDESGYDWLRGQDHNQPLPQRPAFISWWDYGFQSVSEGEHPTVADNFQNGIVPAGNFLLSQNESQAIGILTTTLLTGSAHKTGLPYLPASLNQLLAHDGLNVTIVHSLMVNQSADVALVLGHPEKYLAVDPSHLDGPNAMYDTMAYYLGSLGVGGVAQLYGDVQQYTHWSIRYAMVDSRLFPFSGQQTGIFYAPADLTDRVIGSGGAATTYYTISVTGTDGQTYQLGQVPPGVGAASYNINWLPPFYNTMIYHIFIGYNCTQIGLGSGIPGVQGCSQNGQGANLPVYPGWMMQHFQVVYRTSYYCPPGVPANNLASCFAMNRPAALALAHRTNGTVAQDPGAYFNGGETILQYYPGETMSGTVTLANGAPVANAHVTVYDAWGIPHMLVTTAKDGAYSVVLPPGNDTVNVTTGPLNGLSQAAATVLASIHMAVPDAVGLNPASPTLIRPVVVRPATVQGFVYWNVANNSTYVPTTDTPIVGAKAVLWGGGLVTQTATTDASGTYVFNNLPPGVYNFSIDYSGGNFTPTPSQIFAGAGSRDNNSTGLSPAVVAGATLFSPRSPAAGALVTLTGSSGVIASVTTNLSGGYRLSNVPTGNFTISASLPARGLGAPGIDFSVAKGGQHLRINLTLVPVVSVNLVTLVNGNPTGGLPVRFTPIYQVPSGVARGGPNGTTNGLTPQTAANTNSTLYRTAADGTIHATLPVGNYSVYGVAPVGSTFYAGFESAYLTGTFPIITLAPLFLTPAQRLSGTATFPGASPTLSSPVQVTVFTAKGGQVSAFANSSGHWILELPSGTYSLLAIQGSPAAHTSLYADLVSVRLSGDTVLPLTLGSAALFKVLVGSTLPNGGFFPAAHAQVSVSIGPTGARVTSLANDSGNVTLQLPATLPAGLSYCVNASALGFLPYANCGVSASTLGTFSTIPLTLRAVPVTIHIGGLPAPTTLTLNLSAQGGTAQSVTATGGVFTNVTLQPGTYEVTGWAKPAAPPGLWMPNGIFNVTIPVGSRGTNISFLVLREVTTHGQFHLPSGVLASNVSVELRSPLLNQTLSGTRFTSSFLAAAGSYSVYASAPGAHAALTTFVVNKTGYSSTIVDLTGAGSVVSGDLTQPSGAPLNATLAFPVNVSGVGPPLPVNSVAGHYSITLPRNASFRPTVNTTQLVPYGAASRYVTFTSRPGAVCVAVAAAVTCNIPLIAQSLSTPVTGVLDYPSYPTGLSGNLTIVGPFPSLNRTTIAVTAGGFATSLAPGTYSAYATAGTSQGLLANATSFVVGPDPGAPLTLDLSLTWTDSITLRAPSIGVAGSATVSILTPGGVTLAFSGEPYGTPLSFALPPGLYQVSANASGTPYGALANATASASVALLNGNSATQLTLSYAYARSVRMTLGTPTSAQLGNGGVATFTFSVKNTGNAPVSVRFVGSPSTYNFTFTPANLTLGAVGANSTGGGEVVVRVPAGSLVNHPPVALEAVQVGGSGLWVASPSPVITVAPVLALTLGRSASTEATVGPLIALVPFYAFDSGNLPIGVDFGVQDSARLAALGWTAKIVVSGHTVVAQPTILQPQSNQSFSVQLTATVGHALPPGSVTVVGRVVNGSGSLAPSLTLSVPSLSVSVNSTTLAVTGPGIGSPSPYPDWLVPLLAFVPALAFAAFVVGYRWYRTRRWVRR